MKYKIVKDKEFLTKGTEPVASVEEGEQIAAKLIEALGDLNNLGLGLSANQIGINKQVAVVNVDGNLLTFINPKVTAVSDDRLLYTEGCLSIPGKVLTTVRHKSITVECLNWANPRTFKESNVTEEVVLKKSFTQMAIEREFGPKKKTVDRGILEAVVVQHQLCLLDGILITDKSVKFNKQIVNTVTHGRNDKVMIEKDGKSQFLKYKKAEPLLKDGWKIV